MTLPSQLPRRTILIVDDEAGVRQVIRRSLEYVGYDVLVASSAAEAHEIFQERRSDIVLIISDVMMPHESGPEMVARLSDEEARPPVLYVSGYVEDTALTSIAGQGAPLLSKPFLPEALIQKVEELIGA